MSNLTPLQLVGKLRMDAKTIRETEVQNDVKEAAETISYLIKLLTECASYIEDFNEYDVPPRFIKAVRAVLPN